MDKLSSTVAHLMQQGKGILAADESVPSITKRLEAVHVAPTEENRKKYRLLLTTTPGIEAYLSGIIFFDETLRQTTDDGTPLPVFLAKKNILSGIKVDEGLEEVPSSLVHASGSVTRGLDNLGERVREYRTLGASFAKWRAVARVGDGYADPMIVENAKHLGEYAHICQSESLVPIVEPEVLMDGEHSAEDAEGALIETIAIVVDALKERGVALPHTILKTSMAVSGKSARERADSVEVAERTVRALKTAVPDTMGGVVFLSGGQTPSEAAENLNAIARLEPHPWPITFSFSRALQEPVLDTWRGDERQWDEAQGVFLARLTLVTAAERGGYAGTMEQI